MKQQLIRLTKATILLAGSILSAYYLGLFAYKLLCGVDALSHPLERLRNGAYHSYTTAILYSLYALDIALFAYVIVVLIKFVLKEESKQTVQSANPRLNEVSNQRVRLFISSRTDRFAGEQKGSMQARPANLLRKV